MVCAAVHELSGARRLFAKAFLVQPPQKHAQEATTAARTMSPTPTVDPAKLKVVELRAQLSARGLDTKGNKPVLVKRLKEALEKELEKGGRGRAFREHGTDVFCFCYVMFLIRVVQRRACSRGWRVAGGMNCCCDSTAINPKSRLMSVRHGLCKRCGSCLFLLSRRASVEG